MFDPRERESLHIKKKCYKNTPSIQAILFLNGIIYLHIIPWFRLLHPFVLLICHHFIIPDKQRWLLHVALPLKLIIKVPIHLTEVAYPCLVQHWRCECHPSHGPPQLTKEPPHRLHGPPLNKSPSMIITALVKLWLRCCPGRSDDTSALLLSSCHDQGVIYSQADDGTKGHSSIAVRKQTANL